MKESAYLPRNASHAARMNHRRQRGVILFVTLIALLVLMISGIALIRSFDSSLLLSGNIALKRDLVNQGERGMAAAIAALNNGNLSADTARQQSSAGDNYSAVALGSDSHGIPTILIDDAQWNMTGSDILDNGTKIRYVIDRMCSAAGVESTTNCTYVSLTDKGGPTTQKQAQAGINPVYRISVRVTDARNTQTFLQSTGYH